MKVRKIRFCPIPRNLYFWLVEYLPEDKWDLPWNWKPYCKTLTKAAAEKIAKKLEVKVENSV